MKQFLTLILIILLIYSCSEVDNDCICTEEFRSYLVTVVDTLGAPINSLIVTIKDKDGDELDVVQDPHLFGAGKYTILNDSFTQMFCSCTTPEIIYFSASDGIRIAAGEYLFNTDECKCHINKVSGPDTLVLR